MNLVNLKNDIITYTINKTEASSCYISVQNGEVTVCAPYYLTAAQIQEIVEEKKQLEVSETRSKKIKHSYSVKDPENSLVLKLKNGDVVIEMYPDVAPNHVNRIKELVRQGFYNGLKFHRVIDGFMAQTGCPLGTGTGGSGKKLKAEFNRTPHQRGTVSMARAMDINSGDSQFFICFAELRS